MKLTVLVPCVAPKFIPEIVTLLPTTPALGEIPVTTGELVTVKFDPLLETFETVTTTFPVVAPDGTGTMIPAPVQVVGEAVVPLKVTVLDPCVGPKFVPLMLTIVVTGPDEGDRLAMFGIGVPPAPVASAAPTE